MKKSIDEDQPIPSPESYPVPL